MNPYKYNVFEISCVSWCGSMYEAESEEDDVMNSMRMRFDDDVTDSGIPPTALKTINLEFSACPSRIFIHCPDGRNLAYWNSNVIWYWLATLTSQTLNPGHSSEAVIIPVLFRSTQPQTQLPLLGIGSNGVSGGFSKRKRQQKKWI